jgi:hypothetical protein
MTRSALAREWRDLADAFTDQVTVLRIEAASIPVSDAQAAIREAADRLAGLIARGDALVGLFTRTETGPVQA